MESLDLDLFHACSCNVLSRVLPTSDLHHVCRQLHHNIMRLLESLFINSDVPAGLSWAWVMGVGPITAIEEGCFWTWPSPAELF